MIYFFMSVEQLNLILLLYNITTSVFNIKKCKHLFLFLYKIHTEYIRNTYREELREAMVNFGTRCTDEWVHFDLKNKFVLDYCLKIFASYRREEKSHSFFIPPQLFNQVFSNQFPGSLPACLKRRTKIKMEGLTLKSSRPWCYLAINNCEQTKYMTYSNLIMFSFSWAPNISPGLIVLSQ